MYVDFLVLPYESTERVGGEPGSRSDVREIDYYDGGGPELMVTIFQPNPGSEVLIKDANERTFKYQILDPFANPTPLAHADTSRDVLPRGGTSQLHKQKRK
ncbi:hypothetical protein TNCV_4409671 [Trichonephila clavipes]|nr:hypothetical protein TNCV_4409671 [Trichonephila clavipes]